MTLDCLKTGIDLAYLDLEIKAPNSVIDPSGIDTLIPATPNDPQGVSFEDLVLRCLKSGKKKSAVGKASASTALCREAEIVTSLSSLSNLLDKEQKRKQKVDAQKARKARAASQVLLKDALSKRKRKLAPTPCPAPTDSQDDPEVVFDILPNVSPRSKLPRAAANPHARDDIPETQGTQSVSSLTKGNYVMVTRGPFKGMYALVLDWFDEDEVKIQYFRHHPRFNTYTLKDMDFDTRYPDDLEVVQLINENRGHHSFQQGA